MPSCSSAAWPASLSSLRVGSFGKMRPYFFKTALKVSERGGAHAHVRTYASLARTLTRRPARSPAHPRAHMRTRALTRAHLGRSLFAHFCRYPPRNVSNRDKPCPPSQVYNSHLTWMYVTASHMAIPQTKSAIPMPGA